MRRVTFLLLLLSSIISLTSCDVDPSGFISSSDVDTRFAESASLPEKSNIDIVSPDFSFIVISDTHVYHASHSKLAALKDKILPGDRFILICGDVTQCGSEEDYKAFYNYLNATGLPFYATIGNHDLYYGGWQYYRNTLGKPYYTFTAGPARFISLDSANATLGGKQKKWLEQVLSAKTESLCFVMTHYEFFDPGFTDIEEVYYLMHLLETANVNYVFMGHTDNYYLKKVNGVNYMNVPGFEDGSGEKYFIRILISSGTISYEKLML